jgi:plasmid stabilization system protein ParE
MTFAVLLDNAAQRDFEDKEAWWDENAPEQTERFVADFDATRQAIADHARGAGRKV